jgi:hypothetical protein
MTRQKELTVGEGRRERKKQELTANFSPSYLQEVGEWYPDLQFQLCRLLKFSVAKTRVTAS